MDECKDIVLELISNMIIHQSSSSSESLELSSFDQQLPYDYQFFINNSNIAADAPPFSPGPQSPTSSSPGYEGPSPPASPASVTQPESECLYSGLGLTMSSSDPEDDSPGLLLDPTQAPCHTQFNHAAEESEEEDDSTGGEDAMKVESLETLLQRLNESKDMTENISTEDHVKHEEEEDTDESEEYDTLPLTFNCREDLMWKLSRADLIKPTDPVPSQRPARRREATSPDPSSSVDITPLKKLKTEAVEKEDEAAEDHAEIDDDHDKGEKILNDEGEEVVSRPVLEYQPVSLQTSSGIRLLNRAPRLGLSRLEKKLSNLHEVSIIAPEE